MSVELRQSTAKTLKFGPFLDKTDGVTEETSLTIAQENIRLSKNGGNIAQTNNAAGALHDELGYYDVPLNTTDTNTLGNLRVAVHDKTTHLPVWQDFDVVTQNYYDSKYGTTVKRKADLVSIDGLATNGPNATLNLKQLNINNSAGSAIKAESSGGNGDGMELIKHGTGKDINASEITDIKAKTDNLPETPKKNTDFTNPYQFLMEDSAGAGVTDLVVTGIRILDGIKTGIEASITEVAGGAGYYKITPLAGDTNGDHVTHIFSTVTVGVKNSHVDFWTAT